MKNGHLRERKRIAFRTSLAGRAKIAILSIFTSWFVSAASAQFSPYYGYADYPQLNPLSGAFGTLYNSQPLMIKQATTTYHGKQDVYVTAYLPVIEQEYSVSKPIKLYGPDYTTGIALASPRDPSLELFAPIQVSSADLPLNSNEIERSAFASIIPFGSVPTEFQGPFNTLAQLNSIDDAFVNTTPGEYGISVLAAAQKFTKFSHQLLTDKNGVGWNGWDKEGKSPMKFLVVPGAIPGYHTHIDVNGFDVNEIIIGRNKGANFGIDATHQVIGHEISHCIVVNAVGPLEYKFCSTSFREMDEGFAGIVGHSFRLWMSNGHFNGYDWSLFKEQLEPGDTELLLSDPKSFSLPNTYKGQYYQTDPTSPTYDAHYNGNVLTYWFYLINEGKTGYVDDDVSREAYSVEPLIPGNKDATYKIALRILFNAFTQKINSHADYPELRKATLDAAIDMGYFPGSQVYTQVCNAWSAVGVETTVYNQNCVITSAESLLNGTVAFHARESTLFPTAGSQKLSALLDCSGAVSISTNQADAYKSYMMDWDGDNTYSDDNNAFQSKIAVSVHAFSEVARDWFNAHFNHNGVDGIGKHNLINIMGLDKYQGTHFQEEPNVFKAFIPYKALSACRDQVSQNYFHGVRYFIKPKPQGQTSSEDWNIIEAALGNFFSLEIKKDYEWKNQNANWESIWALYEDLEDPLSLMDFSQPKINGQPALYHGQNWKSGDAKHNTGFLNLFYYLLTHGTEGAEGYVNPELPNTTYFVNKMDKDLVLRVLWNTYKAVAVNAGIEEFRQATMTSLHELVPKPAIGQSKEHIAFYDAWAAVLGLPDYASTLAHFPDEDAVVYPWPVKVGVEAEYPVYESYRLFEVSTSNTFNENVAPVYRFMNSVAPDLATGMTYGYINLEPGKYFVRSHLAQGPDSRAHCEATNDPAFCESLLGKEKWTLPYPFTAGPVPAPVSISPLKGETMPAWSSVFSFGSVAGAMGYDLHVKDPEVTGAEHNIPVDVPYDGDGQSVAIKKKLALSAKRPYSYSVAGKQKLGSEKAVHVLPGGLLQPLTEAEKEQFPTIYSDWAEEVSFETDMPTIALKSPADGAKVPLFGGDVVMRSTRLSPDVADYYQFYLKEPFYESQALADEVGLARFAVHVPGLQGVADQKSYQWAIVPRKKAEPPFIPDEEEGEVAKWHQFIVDKDLAPTPEVDNIDCVAAGSEPVLNWKAVPGAQTYKLTGVDGATHAELGSYQTGQLAGKLSNMSTFPNKYIYKVAAGIMGGNGEWIFGPAAVGDYQVNPPSPSNLSPDNIDNLELSDNQSVVLSWDLPPGINTVQLSVIDNTASKVLVSESVTGNSFTLVGLDFNHAISWSVASGQLGALCSGKDIKASFQTEATPEEFDFGFELRVDNDDPKIFGGLYHYSIRVIRPDGHVDFTGIGTADADTWLQVGFVPEMGQVINGNEMNGQLTDQQGDYLIELEIIDMFQCQNCPDINAHPKIKVRGVEYKRKVGDSAWQLNKSVQPQPSDPEFPSRTTGAKKLIKLHYNLPN